MDKIDYKVMAIKNCELELVLKKLGTDGWVLGSFTEELENRVGDVATKYRVYYFSKVVG